MSDEPKDQTPTQQVEAEEAKNNVQEAYDVQEDNQNILDVPAGGNQSVRSSSLIHSSKMMSTGVSAFGATTAQTDMMKAMIHQRQVEDQQTAIKSRIIKLLKEEERANKRIKDLQRRQDFVKNMHNVKKEKMDMMQAHQMKNKQTEEMNRSRFNEMRASTKNTIEMQRSNFQRRNRSTFAEIKDQQKKIADIVSVNRMDNLRQKQQAFKSVKDRELKAKFDAKMSRNATYNANSNNYASRIKTRLDQATRTQGVSRELENQEQALLEKLQRTYQNEKKMVEQLYQTNALSPVKTPMQPGMSRTFQGNYNDKYVARN